ncbi:hypothetical protein PGT21_005166 [Puccinia graminis f. sp. tritici]|uniref:Uncharacterized protein n=1 Tax=Puccinia graminis f. sp. tritici TaxID=56615 RepID=A0A5B0P8L7_PUCGR|nr:hypothetical protein PGT21_005166 [Puccinia graminis f. sp. tritici]
MQHHIGYIKIRSKISVWKARRALGYFLYFSAPQRVLLRFVVRGNLLDGLVVPLSPPSSASKSTLPQFLTLQSLPTSRAVIRCHPLGLRVSPLRRLSVQVLLRPLLSQVSHRRFRLWSAPNPASAPRCSPLLVAPPQYTLNPRSAVGRDPRRPPMPGLPAVNFSEPSCLCSVSSACFPHQRRKHSACPKQTGQSFGQGALPPPHRKFY